MREVASALNAIKQRLQAADNDAHVGLSAMPSAVQQHIFLQPQPAQITPPIHKVHRREVVISLGALVASVGAGISWKTLTSHLPSATSDNSFPASINTSIPARTYIKHSTPINGVAWSNDSQFIASCSEHMVRVWRVSNGQNIFTYNSRAENNLNGFALSPDGAFLAVASDTEGVIVLNAGDGTPSVSYRQHPTFVNAVCWSPDSTRIASANNDNTVQIWDAASGKNLAIYSGHQASVKAIAWSPNGLYIASAAADGIVRTWGTGTGAMYISFNWNYGRPINAVAWSSDSLYVAEASEDTTVRLLKNSRHGSLPFTYKGHAASVTALSWSPDGKRIASADVNGKTLLWDAFSGEHTLSYGNSSPGIYALAWSPNGKFLATGSEDHTVKIWQVANS